MTIVSDDPTEIEEERRLCYVGITRAEKILNLSSAKMRMVRGETQMNKVSRFIKEIPDEYLNIENNSSGYKGKISYGGKDESEEQPAYNIRANAKAALSRYGCGITKYKQSDRVKIGGASKPGGMYKSSGYGNTIYGSAKKAIRDTANAGVNKKVGFGKEFPMDIFDLKKTTIKASSSEDTGKSLSKESSGGLGYSVGDTVEHSKFGKGRVISIDHGERDYMVSVKFDEFGLKKMLAGFARLKKI